MIYFAASKLCKSTKQKPREAFVWRSLTSLHSMIVMPKAVNASITDDSLEWKAKPLRINVVLGMSLSSAWLGERDDKWRHDMIAPSPFYVGLTSSGLPLSCWCLLDLPQYLHLKRCYPHPLVPCSYNNHSFGHSWACCTEEERDKEKTCQKKKGQRSGMHLMDTHTYRATDPIYFFLLLFLALAATTATAPSFIISGSTFSAPIFGAWPWSTVSISMMMTMLPIMTARAIFPTSVFMATASHSSNLREAHLFKPEATTYSPMLSVLFSSSFPTTATVSIGGWYRFWCTGWCIFHRYRSIVNHEIGLACLSCRTSCDKWNTWCEHAGDHQACLPPTSITHLP